MKKNIIVLVVIVFVFSFNALDNFDNENAIEEIENLLNKRIMIINDFLYNNKDFIKLKIKLEEIENNTLLKSDLDILSRVINNPTSYELAKNVEIENIIDIKTYDDSIELTAFLNWTSQGYDGEKHILKKYEIQCMFSNDKLYLSNLKNIQ